MNAVAAEFQPSRPTRPGVHSGLRVVVIDNYDSFTWNLVQYLGELGCEFEVVRNDEITVEALGAREPSAIVISPGPCTPAEAGISVETVRALGTRTPILGVCLGHQSIGAAFGARIVRARTLMHGKTSMIHHDGRGVFAGIESPFEATRYHSLAIERDSLPECLVAGAWTEDGEIMGVRHRTLAIEGVQFHPESIMTRHGHDLLDNFLNSAQMAGGNRD